MRVRTAGRFPARLCVVASLCCMGATALPAVFGAPGVALAAEKQSDPATTGSIAARRGVSTSARDLSPVVQLPDVPPPPAFPDRPAGLLEVEQSSAPAVLPAPMPATGSVASIGSGAEPKTPASEPQPVPSGAEPSSDHAVPTAAPDESAPAVPVETADVGGGVAADALKTALDVFAKADPPGLRHNHVDAALRKQRDAIVAFYGLRGNASLWVAGQQWDSAARKLIDVIAHAADDGLDLSAYRVPASPGVSDADKAAAELTLSEAVAAYGFQASGGRIEPSDLGPLLGDKPVVADASRVLVDVAISQDPAAVLQALNPPQPGYRALRDKLAEMNRAHALVAHARIPSGPPLRIGMRDPRVSLIRARFGLDVAKATTDGLVYDTVVATAVAGFQRANGLPPSGVLTTRTAAVLSGNVPEAAENEIVANMERWRWLPRDMGDDRIDINVPEYTLRLFRGGSLIHHARVIVGKPTTQTPIFSDRMRYLTINPSWYVPQSIIKKEMMPHLAEDPDYLTRQGYEVSYHGNQISVRQPPGDRNALGHIIFWFPNQYAVYLHDTPARAMFGNDKRAFSHGCMRVEQPFKLAELVLEGENGMTEERLRKMIGSSEHYLNIPHPLPIHVTYFTAFVDDDGKLEMRDDIYGYSKRVREALGLDT